MYLILSLFGILSQVSKREGSVTSKFCTRNNPQVIGVHKKIEIRKKHSRVPTAIATQKKKSGVTVKIVESTRHSNILNMSLVKHTMCCIG